MFVSVFIFAYSIEWIKEISERIKIIRNDSTNGQSKLRKDHTEFPRNIIHKGKNTGSQKSKELKKKKKKKRIY
jgi:hypothetical protein